MYRNTNRDVASRGRWESGQAGKEHSQDVIFKINIKFLQNQVVLWWQWDGFLLTI